MKSKTLKKVLYIALFLVLMALSLAGCSNPDADTPGGTGQPGGSVTVSNGKNFIDAISYHMELALDTQTNSLSELVTIEVRNLTDQPQAQLCIRDMTPEVLKFCEENYSESNPDLNNMISSITLTETGEALSYTFGENESIIWVDLGEGGTIQPGETGSITIDMTTDIPDRGDRFGFRKTDQGTLYALSFCFPYLADNVDGKWQTDPFFDDGESRSYHLADYSVVFHAPESYKVAMTGTEDTSGGITAGTASDVRDFAIVACDFMELDTFMAGDIRVNNYYLNGSFTEEYRAVTKAAAEDSLAIFTGQIGPYPYGELDMLPCLFGFGYGGMEYPGLIMVNASSFFDGPFYDAISMEEKISHEIAHQWFYGAVGNCEYRQGWLDEGFATLLEKDIYGLADCPAHDLVSSLEPDALSQQDKEDYRNFAIETAREDFKDIYLNVAPDAYPADQYYGYAEYDGGYAFLQEVRLQLGDEAFMDFVRGYYEKFYMKTATTRDVLDMLRAIDGSEEMEEIIGFYFE